MLEPLAEGIERLGRSEVSLEQVASLSPDLILSAAFNGELFEGIPIATLEEIAPTVAYDFQSDYMWREYYRFFADVLGRAPEAEDVLGGLDDQIAGLADRLPDPASTTVSVLRVHDDGSLWNYRTDQSFAGSVLDPIGFPVALALSGVVDCQSGEHRRRGSAIAATPRFAVLVPARLRPGPTGTSWETTRPECRTLIASSVVRVLGTLAG